MDSKLTFVSNYAEVLLQIHGLTKWRFEYDNAKRRYGCCHYRTRRITLSRYLVKNSTTPFRVIKNIILHEIAHALVGYAAGHNEVWRECAIRIGCDGKRTCNFPVAMPGRKILRCPCGQISLPRFRVCKKFLQYRCRKCNQNLYVSHIPNEATPTPQREP